MVPRVSPPATSIARILPAADSEKALRLLVRRRGGFLPEHLDRLRALPAHGNRKLFVDQLFRRLR